MKKTSKLCMVVALALVFALCFSVTAFAANDNVVISYNSPQLWVNWGNVLAGFTKATGITAPNDNKNAGQTLSALIAEQGSPVADTAYLSISYAYKSNAEDVMDCYKPEGFDDLPDSLKDADGRWFTVHYGATAILCNTEVLDDLPLPTSYADLLDPMYKGMIAFYDPPSSGVGYSVCTNINLAYGGTLDNWDPCYEYFTKMMENEPMFPKQDATAKLMKGEIGILVCADFTGYSCKYNEMAPIEVVLPSEGYIRIPYTMSLVKNAPHADNGKALIDFCMSDEGQKLFAEGFVRPVKTAALTEDLKAKFLSDEEYENVIDLDYEAMANVQDNFMDQWVLRVYDGSTDFDS